MKTYCKKAEPQQNSGQPYTQFLDLIHNKLQPQSYFEIGTATGDSLKLARCPALCVDPSFRINSDVFTDRPLTFMFQMTSDQFFRDYDVKTYLPRGPDLSFLDGMHLFEYLLRDFFQTERHSHRRSMITIHDCLPLNKRMAQREIIRGEIGEPHFDAWTGDVWKIIPVLQTYRKDLRIAFADCPPTGLVIVSNLDPSSTILFDNYYKIVDEFINADLDAYGFSALFEAYPTLDTKKVTADTNALTGLYSLR